MAKPSCSGLDPSKRCPPLGDKRDELDSKLDSGIFPIGRRPSNVELSRKDYRDDRLSNLPDDIVLNIVERLDTAD